MVPTKKPVAVAGADIDAYCSKCELELAHVIIAMAGAKPARVVCKTCRTEHAYRTRAKAAGTTPRTRAAGGSKRAGGSRGGPKEGSYDQLIAGQDLSRAIRYAPATTFTEGQVLDHKLFGLGFVLKELPDAKIDVVFPAGTKTLVHARSA